jgi:hypothetical protein
MGFLFKTDRGRLEAWERKARVEPWVVVLHGMGRSDVHPRMARKEKDVREYFGALGSIIGQTTNGAASYDLWLR